MKSQSRHNSLTIVSVALALGLLTCLLTSCQPSYEDITDQIKVQPLALPEGYLTEVAWLPGNQLAFDYRPDFHSPSLETRVRILDLGTASLREIPLPPLPENCFSAWWDLVKRLPNGKLGLVYHCNNEPSGYRDTLYMWDSQSEVLQILLSYPHPFGVGDFAYSTDMSELIQEDIRGAALSQHLYRFYDDGRIERLLPTFQRAHSPSRSIDDWTIAFVGTEIYPGGDPDTFTQWRQIEGLARHPWDLYLMEGDGTNVRSVLSGLTDVHLVKWSPTNKNLLAFVGRYKGKDGLWLFDTVTSDLRLVWSGRLTYDWSPDGTQMFVIAFSDYDEVQGVQSTPIGVITIPDEYR